MRPLTKRLEAKQNELIRNKDVEGCIKFLRDNDVDGNKIAKMVLGYGGFYVRGCRDVLKYAKGLEPDIINKLALRICVNRKVEVVVFLTLFLFTSLFVIIQIF